MAAGPSTWPAQSSLTRDGGRATLLMFVHPMCPCSRASVGELSRVMARTGDDLDVQVIAMCPKDAPADWQDSKLVQSVRDIPRVKLVYDRTGEESKRFGALTSGHVALYDREGVLAFTGGVTAARGHAGDNAGADAIVSVVRNRTGGMKHTQTSVYGCLLPGPQLEQKEEPQQQEQ